MVSTSPRAPGGPGDRRLRRDAFWHYGRPTGRVVALCLAVALVAIARPVRAQAAMSLADRVACRMKVEDVYWAHRIWPRENPGPKPPRTAVLSNEQIAQRSRSRYATRRRSDDLRAGAGEMAEIEWLRKAPGGSDERLDARRIALTEESWNRRA